MSEASLTVLLGRDDAALVDAVRAISPRIRTVSARELERAPERVTEIEVAYGGLSRSRIQDATALRWLQTGGAGVNGLLTPEFQARGILLTNASGIHAEPITEHMFGMLLMVTRALGVAWDQQKSGRWKSDTGPDYASQVSLLSGRTLGILGVGAIGGHSARVGRAFGMRVIGCRRSGEPHPDVEVMHTEAEKLKFFAAADVVMNSLPLTERTRHFIGSEAFAALPDGAIVINTGRGPTIDTDALVAALESGRLGAALLDVTDPEPLPEGHPLWTMDRVFITPHFSGSHPGYWRRADAIFLENLRRFLDGAPLHNLVDQAEGY